MDAIGSTFGTLYIGAMIAMAMYGITTLQTYFYFLYYPKDGVGMKTLVSSVWVLDSLHIIFVSISMYHYLIDNYSNPDGLVDVAWTLYASIGLNVIMAFVVQSFFTKRIFRLCKPSYRWWLSSSIAFIVFAHLCFGIETVVELAIQKQFSRLREIAYIAAVPFAIVAILSDVMIAGALCVLLNNTRSDFQDTNHIVNKLIVFAINRCLLTSVCAITEVIVFVSLPNSLYTLAFDFVIGKLYTNSLLATLNSRHALRKQEDDPSSSESGRMSTSFRLATIVSGADHNAVSLVRVGTNTEDRLAMSDVESSVYHQPNFKDTSKSIH